MLQIHANKIPILSLSLSPPNYGNLISEKKCGNNDSKRQIASNKKQNQNIDEDTNSFGALNFVRNTILAACFLLPRALHTQNFLPSLRLSLLARKKTNYTKKKFHKKNKNKNLYQRNRSCSSLPALTYLFISATATKELTRMCRARISRNHESASRRHSVQAKLERSKLRASTSLYPTKRVTD